MPSIVKVPTDNAADYDFLAFSYKGLHSYQDFGLIRVSDGDRYNENLLPTLNDKTAENPGADGMYYFNTNYKQKDFNINFAFDKLTDLKMRQIKSWFSGKELGDLWFAENPYKVYSAKVTGQPTIKFIPFDDVDEDGNKIRVYKGEGSVTFTAYYPFAHTPDYVQQKNGELLDGNHYTSYVEFSNYEQLINVLPRVSDQAYGDFPFHFIATLDDVTEEGDSNYVKTTITTDNNGMVYSLYAPGAEVNTDNGVYEVKN